MSLDWDIGVKLSRILTRKYYEKLLSSHTEKIVYSFVPGGLTELIKSFGLFPFYPELCVLRQGLFGNSQKYIELSHEEGFSQDICSYVKCSLGMIEELPKPSLLLLSNSGCSTYVRWFEALKRKFNSEIITLDIPPLYDRKPSKAHIKYVTTQLIDLVIPKLERISGKKFDLEKLRSAFSLSFTSESIFSEIFDLARHSPSPIDAFFNGVYYVAPIFGFYRGSREALNYYLKLKKNLNYRIKNKIGHITPLGFQNEQKWRLVIDGPPPWGNFFDFWDIFIKEKATIVGSSYTKVGGAYMDSFRHDPQKPIESMAEYLLTTYTNRDLNERIRILCEEIIKFKAHGFIIHSTKSCDSFSAGAIFLMTELQKKTKRPGCFIESDILDKNYFSESNLRLRLHAFFRTLENNNGSVLWN